MVSVIPENVTEYADCLTALVPVLQQAEVDYYASPDETNALILDPVAAYDTFWVYSQGVADFSVATQLEIGLVGNGTDDIVGNVDFERVQSLVDIATRDLRGRRREEHRRRPDRRRHLHGPVHRPVDRLLGASACRPRQ